MSWENRKYCDNCGGPLRTSYSHCKYCGSPVQLKRKLSEKDRKRIVLFARIMDEMFYRLFVRAEHKVNQMFVVPNMLLLLGITLLLYVTTHSFLYTGIAIALLAFYVFKSFYAQYEMAVYSWSKHKVYKKYIEPPIEQFLTSFNYYGCEWDKITRELVSNNKISWLDKYLRPPEVKRSKESKADSVLRFLNEILATHVHTKKDIKEMLVFLLVGYINVLTYPLFALFLSAHWIPLLWIVPVFVFFYLEMTQTTFILIRISFFNPLKQSPGLDFYKKSILPVLEDYCKTTKTEMLTLMGRAKKLELFYIRNFYERIYGRLPKTEQKKKLKILVLTDHTTHVKGESIYPLLVEMLRSPLCDRIDVASRGNSKNDDFFYKYSTPELFTTTIDEDFKYDKEGKCFLLDTKQSLLSDYDVIFLRIDRPATYEFLHFLADNFPWDKMINRPWGINQTGSKEFLLNFPDLCPPIKLCETIEDVEEFIKQYPAVLKPLKGYGGKGLIKIENDEVWVDGKTYAYRDYRDTLAKDVEEGYLAMKFLKNVVNGDKRVLVVNGKIMGATLRTPPEGSFICNFSQGGTSQHAEVTEEDKAIAVKINPSIIDEGVLIYGFDTIEDDDGRRLLSEINTLNVGGLIQAQEHSGKPVIKETVDEIWKYIKELFWYAY